MGEAGNGEAIKQDKPGDPCNTCGKSQSRMGNCAKRQNGKRKYGSVGALNPGDIIVKTSEEIKNGAAINS